MANSSSTFDDLWKHTGLFNQEGLDVTATIREPNPGLTQSPGSLPPLSIDEHSPSVERGSTAQLMVEELLGEGGMGQVHSARQPLLDREVAIKRLKANSSENARVGLLREARYMGSLEHPNIVPVHALGADEEGNPVLVMKRIRGTEWRDMISDPDHEAWKKWGGVSTGVIPRNIEVLISVCRAIDFAHKRDVLHRDLKPENIMIGIEGDAYVLDWGVACRLSKPNNGPVVGTPVYMAPEMVKRGGSLSPATDVYLLGACLYEVLNGRAPHQGDTLKAVLENAFISAPPRFGPEVPRDLGAICARCLSADPSDRYATAGELNAALVTWLRNRASAELAVSAHRSLERLESIAATDAPDPIQVSNAFAECRFGYQQALERWPENTAAQAGLNRAMKLMIRHELTRENLDHARALIQEMQSDDSGILMALTEVEHRIAEREQRLRDQDFSLSVRQRSNLLLSLGVLGACTTIGVIFFGFPAEPATLTPKAMFSVGFGFLTSILMVVFISRERLLEKRSAFNLVVCLVAASSGSVAMRAINVLVSDRVAMGFANDLTLIGVVGAIAATYTGDRIFAYATALAAGSAIGCILLPDFAVHIFASATTMGFFIAGIVWRFQGSENTP